MKEVEYKVYGVLAKKWTRSVVKYLSEDTDI